VTVLRDGLGRHLAHDVVERLVVELGEQIREFRF
jgi:hypothetical protein